MRRVPYPVGCSSCCCWFIRAVVLTRNLLVATGLGQQIKAEKHTEKSKKSLFTRRDDVQSDSLSVYLSVCPSVGPASWSATLNIYFSCRRSSKPICQHLGKHFNKPSYNPRCSPRQFRSLDQFYLSLPLFLSPFICLTVKHVKCNFRNLSAHFLQLHCLATNKISIDSQLIIFQMC